MIENARIPSYVCTAYCFHVVDGPTPEALLITRLVRLAPLPQGEAK